MRIKPLVVVAVVALGSSGCANLTTQDRFSNTLRLACEARSNAETTTLTATISAIDAKDPAERLDLALTDRLSIRSGKYGAGLSRHTDMRDLHDGETALTHAYEAAIPTGPKLEFGFTRWEGEAVWAEVVLPTPPELTLTGEEKQHLAWPPSTSGTQDSLEIFVACDDGELPKVDENQNGRGGQPGMPAGVAARYKPPRDDGGIDVDALLGLAKTKPAYTTAADWSKCGVLSVVVARSATVSVPGPMFGASTCSVESSRGIKLPPRAALTVPAESPR